MTLTSFCTAKGTITKTLTYRLEETFANNVANKGLITKIHKQLTQLSNKSKQLNQKNGQKTSADVYSKKTYRWPRGT